MGIATEMKKLGDEIIASYDMRVRAADMRVKAVGELVQDTHTTLKGFGHDRTKMAAQQTKDLAAFMNGLSKDVHSLLKSARDMIQQFHRDNTQMSKEQAKNLADFVNNLVTDVGSMLSSFEKDHKNMSKELRNKLAGEIKDIQAEVGRILSDADKLIGEFNADMAQAKKAWGNMSATLGKAGRKNGPVGIEAGEKVRTVKNATAGKAKAKRKTTKKGKSGKRKVAVGV